MATLFPCVTRSARALFVMIALVTISGCGSFEIAPIRQMLSPTPDTTQAEEIENRERFQRTQDPEALRWLIANRLENGMTRAEVEGVIGQPGRFEPNDRLLKTNNNAYRSSDKMYAFGPDSKSRTYFLVFRDNRLVGFDPKEFAADDFESTGL